MGDTQCGVRELPRCHGGRRHPWTRKPALSAPNAGTHRRCAPRVPATPSNVARQEAASDRISPASGLALAKPLEPPLGLRDSHAHRRIWAWRKSAMDCGTSTSVRFGWAEWMNGGSASRATRDAGFLRECYPCPRTEVSPMSPTVHLNSCSRSSHAVASARFSNDIWPA